MHRSPSAVFDIGYKDVWAVTIPAIVLNVAAPLTVTLQTSLLGIYGGSSVQAAFAAVNTTSNFICLLFNFLIDGVSAKVGQSAGASNYAALRQRVRIALLCALAAGLIACAFLAGLQGPISMLLDLTPAVRREAAVYWWLRAALAPVLLLNMAINGILQGYNRVGINAALNTGQSLLELAGSAVVLALLPAPPQGRLAGMGAVSLACAVLSACLGGICVVTLAPVEAKPSELDETLLESGAAQAEERQLPHGDEDAARREERQQETADGGAEEDAGEHFWDFIKDGLNWLMRSTTLQGTFFLAVTVAGRLGTASLAAHQVVQQLWMLTAYVADGIGVAGTVLGSRLSAVPDLRAHRKFHWLVLRLASLGGIFGLFCGVALWVKEAWVVSLFTSDAEVAAVLHNHLWLVLCVIQPVNSVVFLYDGIMVGVQQFAFVRTVMVSGFVLVFLPVLATAQWHVKALWAVWLAKAAHNIYRAVGAYLCVHVDYERKFWAKLEGL